MKSQSRENKPISSRKIIEPTAGRKN